MKAKDFFYLTYSTMHAISLFFYHIYNQTCPYAHLYLKIPISCPVIEINLEKKTKGPKWILKRKSKGLN